MNNKTLHAELTEEKLRPCPEVTLGGEDSNKEKSFSDIPREDDGDNKTPTEKQKSPIQKWAEARPSLDVIMSMSTTPNRVTSTEEMKPSIQESIEDVEDVFHDTLANEGISSPETEHEVLSPKSVVTWKKELEVLVQGGVPRNIRGEVSSYTFMPVPCNLDIVILYVAKTNISFAGMAGLCWCTNTTGGKLLPEFAGQRERSEPRAE